MKYLLTTLLICFALSAHAKHPQCAGSLEPENCERMHDEIDKESAAKKKNSIATQQSEQTPTLSGGFPLRTDRSARSLPSTKLPTAFAWLAKLPFGVSEQQFSTAFKSAKCFDFDGRTCSIKNLSVKCLEGVNSLCNELLLGFDANGLKSVVAGFLTHEEFLEFVKSLIASFGEGDQKSFDMRPQVILSGVIVKWKINGGALEVNMNEGLNDRGRYYRSDSFSVTTE